MLSSSHNPDILTCLANLSSDEVFTPPRIADQMLDMLPEKIWSDENIKFLDPASKSGVFLRSITKRLLRGLENKFTNVEERLDHILKNQVFGIGITKLTAEISRRTLYCSRKANGKYSIVKFNNEEGNLKFFETEHSWTVGNKCKYCGVSKDFYHRDVELESYSYSFIHGLKPEELFNMKFDVIIGNPPYQMQTGTTSAQATPIYDKFVESAIRLHPRYLIMIIPSRWFSGGMGLNNFRKKMLEDKRIRKMVDYPNSKDCFSGVSISGGVNYFLWDREYNGYCEFKSNTTYGSSTRKRDLSEFDLLIRDNIGVDIVKKVNKLKEKSLSEIVSPINLFNLKTSFRGEDKDSNNSLKVFHSNGFGYMNKRELKNGHSYVNKYKIMLSNTTSEHAGEPSKDGKYKLFSTIKVLGHDEIATFSYLILGCYEKKTHAENLKNYLTTKFSRFLVLQAISSIHISKEKFSYLPLQDFSKSWTDEYLYKKYNLSEPEIKHIENLIKGF